MHNPNQTVIVSKLNTYIFYWYHDINKLRLFHIFCCFRSHWQTTLGRWYEDVLVRAHHIISKTWNHLLFLDILYTLNYRHILTNGALWLFMQWWRCWLLIVVSMILIYNIKAQWCVIGLDCIDWREPIRLDSRSPKETFFTALAKELKIPGWDNSLIYNLKTYQ